MDMLGVKVATMMFTYLVVCDQVWEYSGMRIQEHLRKMHYAVFFLFPATLGFGSEDATRSFAGGTRRLNVIDGLQDLASGVQG